MISTRAPSRTPFTVAVEITSGPQTCSRATVGFRPRRSERATSGLLSPTSASSSSNSYRLKDGTRRKAKPHWKFQSLGSRGERKYKNIPENLVPRLKKLVEDGRRYRRLEKEYSRLVTEESLAALKKTAGEG